MNYFHTINPKEIQTNPKKKYTQHEQKIQEQFFRDLAEIEKFYKDIAFLHHIPNGGLRNKQVAIGLKKSGTKKGVWDLFLPKKTEEHSGMYIEFKYGKGYLTVEQQVFGEFVQENGYATAVCYTAEEGITAVLDYLNNKRIHHAIRKHKQKLNQNENSEEEKGDGIFF